MTILTDPTEPVAAIDVLEELHQGIALAVARALFEWSYRPQPDGCVYIDRGVGPEWSWWASSLDDVCAREDGIELEDRGGVTLARATDASEETCARIAAPFIAHLVAEADRIMALLLPYEWDNHEMTDLSHETRIKVRVTAPNFALYEQGTSTGISLRCPQTASTSSSRCHSSTTTASKKPS